MLTPWCFNVFSDSVSSLSLSLRHCSLIAIQLQRVYNSTPSTKITWCVYAHTHTHTQQRQIYAESGQRLEKSFWLRGRQDTVWKAATRERAFRFYSEPIKPDGVKSAGLIGRLRMPAKWRRRPWHHTQH